MANGLCSASSNSGGELIEISNGEERMGDGRTKS